MEIADEANAESGRAHRRHALDRRISPAHARYPRAAREHRSRHLLRAADAVRRRGRHGRREPRPIIAAREAALRAYLRNFVKEHDAEE
ncbi:hypothetical protein BCPG_04337 [Burkholderia cenocepacia PC184]|nr:hypothetical protein BCPG_04337 [Burkholderia cenocepacia PC184]